MSVTSVNTVAASIDLQVRAYAQARAADLIRER